MQTYYVHFRDAYTGAYYKLYSETRKTPPTTLYNSHGVVARDVEMPVPLKNIVLPVMVEDGADYWTIFFKAVEVFTTRYGIDPSTTSCDCCSSSDYEIKLYTTLVDAVEDTGDNERLD